MLILVQDWHDRRAGLRSVARLKSYREPFTANAVKGLAKCRPSPGGVIALGGKGPVEHAGPIWEIGFSPI